MEKNELFYTFDYYGVNNDYEDYHKLEPFEGVNFEHKDLSVAKKFIIEDLKELDDKKDNDIVVCMFKTTEGDGMFEILIYKNNDWIECEDTEFIVKNKFELLHEGGEFKVSRKDTVDSWEDIVDNFTSFQEVDKNEPSQVRKYYSSFFHWYYYPKEGLFAPSKYLGYKGSTIEGYDSAGSGGETQIALKKYFTKLDKGSDEFKKLYRELSQISKNNFGKDLNDRILNGTGGIYIPKS